MNKSTKHAEHGQLTFFIELKKKEQLVTFCSILMKVRYVPYINKTVVATTEQFSLTDVSTEILVSQVNVSYIFYMFIWEKRLEIRGPFKTTRKVIGPTFLLS